jgi:hypothetical protein
MSVSVMKAFIAPPLSMSPSRSRKCKSKHSLKFFESDWYDTSPYAFKP